MFLTKKVKLFPAASKMLSLVLLLVSTTAMAAEPPKPSSLNNPLALTLVTLMIVLLVVIFMLGKLLTDIAEVKLKKEKEQKSGNTAAVTSAVIALLLCSNLAFAQEAGSAVPQTIGGLSAFIFYVMISILFIELLVILALLINIRFLLKKEQKVFEEPYVFKPKKLIAWWGRLNSFKPVEQEAELEMEHDYDGIKELDNKLPPWWLWGFYVSILFAVVYMWRYHVAYSAPLSIEEYEISVKKADEEVKAYLASQGEAIDENTVTVMMAPADLAAGKQIYAAVCIACHKEDGGGLVGPNLTDDYWMHGGDIKSVFKTIKYGINAMPAWQASYSNKQLAQVASYVKSLHGTNPPDAKAQEGELYKEDAAVAEAPAAE